MRVPDLPGLRAAEAQRGLADLVLVLWRRGVLPVRRGLPRSGWGGCAVTSDLHFYIDRCSYFRVTRDDNDIKLNLRVDRTDLTITLSQTLAVAIAEEIVILTKKRLATAF